ncbi:uncharacterized protein LOC119665849 [Teleopsis dalmanni]|uniref:uncharacterized protein LOC119665849 n=1 Tax=Teleopsis dalmanni TaxID=139649 RepID=UPI0018CE5DD3|nr:uncharacterized protein LOC119665849 [Teleopsis dalmanni]
MTGGHVKGNLATLKPFIDKSGECFLIRVEGRITNSDTPETFKHQLLSPKDEAFVRNLVIYFHRVNYHVGSRALVATIQQRFWIINSPLPKERVTPSRPFTMTGVDFAGPIFTYLKIRGKALYKSYISVFICFATKAVHLEAVTDLTSDAFIAALKRFVGRRGLPRAIHCDNATNFVGAKTKLKELRHQFHQDSMKNAIISHCAISGIEFSLITPRAPHFGSLWEATVKTAKGHLYRTLFNAHLTFK